MSQSRSVILPPPRSVTCNGFTFSHRILELERAVGSALVLLHGFGGDINSWYPNHAALARNRPVLALDLPGHGASDKSVGDGSIESLAAFVMQFLRATNVGPVHLCGHSLGGSVCLAIARAAPECVRSLALIAPLGLGATADSEWLAGFVAAGSADAMRPILARLVARPGLITELMVAHVMRLRVMDGSSEALARISGALQGSTQRSTKYVPLVNASRFPTWIMWGEADGIVPLAQVHPDVRVTTVLPGVGHLPPLEEPARFNAELDAFLMDVDAGAPPR